MGFDNGRKRETQQRLPLRADPVDTALAALTQALADAAAASSGVTLGEARAVVAEHLTATGAVTPLSLDRFSGLWARFQRYAERIHGIVLVAEVDGAVVREFLDTRTSTGGLPSVSTARARLTAVRLLYRVLRELRLADHDPTLDVRLEHRSYPSVRALTDQEVEACRWASLATLIATREPAVWALAEAGASTGEIGFVRTPDLDLVSARAWVSGGRKGAARWLPLDDWEATQLGRRARQVGTDAPLAYAADGSYDSRRSSVTAVLTRILRRAGLGAVDGVEPRSVSAWVGRRVLDDTRRIEAVALRLGLRSLDLAADVIGWDWSSTEDAA